MTKVSCVHKFRFHELSDRTRWDLNFDDVIEEFHEEWLISFPRMMIILFYSIFSNDVSNWITFSWWNEWYDSEILRDVYRMIYISLKISKCQYHHTIRPRSVSHKEKLSTSSSQRVKNLTCMRTNWRFQTPEAIPVVSSDHKIFLLSRIQVSDLRRSCPLDHRYPSVDFCFSVIKVLMTYITIISCKNFSKERYRIKCVLYFLYMYRISPHSFKYDEEVSIRV